MLLTEGPVGTELSWAAPVNLGGVAVLYDTLRSEESGHFLSPECVESADGSDTMAVDAATPDPGAAFFYVIRARNACPAIEWLLGTGSDGFPRFAPSCP